MLIPDRSEIRTLVIICAFQEKWEPNSHHVHSIYKTTKAQAKKNNGHEVMWQEHR